MVGSWPYGARRVNNQVVGHGIDGHCLLRQAEEKLAVACRSSPVEAEAELVQVVVKMFVAGRALVGSHQPALEHREDAVDTGQ